MGGFEKWIQGGQGRVFATFDHYLGGFRYPAPLSLILSLSFVYYFSVMSEWVDELGCFGAVTQVFEKGAVTSSKMFGVSYLRSKSIVYYPWTNSSGLATELCAVLAMVE